MQTRPGRPGWTLREEEEGGFERNVIRYSERFRVAV